MMTRTRTSERAEPCMNSSYACCNVEHLYLHCRGSDGSGWIVFSIGSWIGRTVFRTDTLIFSGSWGGFFVHRWNDITHFKQGARQDPPDTGQGDVMTREIGRFVSLLIHLWTLLVLWPMFANNANKIPAWDIQKKSFPDQGTLFAWFLPKT